MARLALCTPSLKRWHAVALALTLAACGLLATSSPARAAESTCPATFHVLHDDHIGKLSLPEGHYEITLLDDSAKLTCARASTLFHNFLEDFDGNLPGKWKVAPRRSEFLRGGSGVGFRVRRVDNPSGGGGGGRHPSTGETCPFLFSVLHNDRIGKLKLPKGQYRITLLSSGKPPCQRASKLFARFLQDVDGNLPGPWRLHVAKATFYRTPSYGFRVKRAGGGGGGGGGGKHPSGGAKRCPAAFRVLHNDRIGKLRLPKGRYRITVLRPKRLGCSNASSLFTQFLQDFTGNLPKPWRIQVQSGTFLKGHTRVGFRVKHMG